MMRLNDFVEELRYSLSQQDHLKIGLVLDDFGQMDAKTQRMTIYELSKASGKTSLPYLARLANDYPVSASKIPELRQVIFSKLMEYPEFFAEAAAMSEPECRKIFIQAVGELELESAGPALVALLDREDDESILMASLSALGMICFPGAINTLTDYIYSPIPSLSLEAINSLGNFDTPTAVQRLVEGLKNISHEKDIAILDVLARSQSPLALEELNKLLGSHYFHIRNHAKDKLAQMGVKAVPLLVENLRREDPDLQIHSLNVLAEIKDASAVMSIKRLLAKGPKDPNVRFAAYESLGFMPVKQGAFALATGLEDPVQHVAMAAAKAIDRNYNEVLQAGLRNMIKVGGYERDRVLEIIIIAGAENVFLSLANDEGFLEAAIEYLKTKAPADVRSAYTVLLKKHGFKAAKISERPQTRKAEKREIKEIWVVDDSKMILRIYKSTLHSIGLHSRQFEYPVKALRELKNSAPDLLFTDLNMPEMSGTELIRKTREIHPKDRLPIIMVTTQNDIQDTQDAMEAGVTRILHKPFDAASLGLAIAETAPHLLDDTQLKKLKKDE